MRIMILFIVVASLFILQGCQQKPEKDSNAKPESSTKQVSVSDASKKKMLAAKDALVQQLSGRLKEAMSSEGPAAAIKVCSEYAPLIAREVGEKYGVSIGRTSFKLRNPKNKPPAWAEKWIEDRLAEPKFLNLESGSTAALLPINLKVECLLCHGSQEQMPEEVRIQLTKLYPDDKATGFQQGDLRGWFWIELPSSK